MAAEFVLDSSAILALLNDEAGADVVAEILPSSVVSTVNLAEVIASLVNKGVSGADAEAALLTLDCKSEPFRREEALLAGRLRESTRQAGLSLGDRACLALALSLGLPVLTADRAWRNLPLEVEVRLIR